MTGNVQSGQRCCVVVDDGDGQNLSSAPPSTVSHSLPPHNETSSLGLWTSAPTVTSVDRNTTVTSQLNASSSSPPKSLAPATLSSLNTTEGPQNTDHGTNRSVDVSSLPIPIANSVEANQTNLDDAKPINSTLGVTSSTNFMATEPSQAKEAQGPTTAPQPKSSIFSTLRPTERTSETTLVTNHEAITEENTAESTSVPSAIVTDRRVVTLEAFSTTPEAVSSTLLFHRATSMDTEKPANHVQGKTFVSDTKDYDMPSVPAASPAGEDPLVIAVIFTFVVTVGILALMGFLRYRQRSSRLQFRRLQDLPMDDMEDTPLSRYSY
ncbi:mucin-5AC-like isoform X2 [Hemicordylus capensis]|uniref:mucin-5AC-like isoform X2 n=1 Tax=Hemicordylus capensis TaxID=884348 RepID=UPI0023032587|nr:mucin-5AC-like isoform X2 [Hemicordylus capensis]